MKKILVILLFLPMMASSQNLTNNTNIEITKSWSQEPNGYTYPIAIEVPSSSIPTTGYPVCILLHGNGGNGSQFVNQFSDVLECHVLVAPTGYMNSWNICAENSDAPDVEMVGDLVDSIQSYSNINPNKIRILGFSNGAGLANSVFIENTDTGVDIICAVVSHLNEPQYHLDDFYKTAIDTDSSLSYCGYSQSSTPLSSRKYLSISNDNDPIIPYTGGYSMVGLDFLHAEDAIFAIAQNQGYTGNIISGAGTAIGNPVVFEYSYLSGNVVHIRGNAQHSMNPSQEDYIKSFFEDCSTTTVSVNKTEPKILSIYPNPFDDILTIEMDIKEDDLFELYSVTGKLLLSGNIATTDKILDLSSLTKGVYILKVGNQHARIIKSK
ncbi:MAG: T9SS type A sorting domain-containing protein [Saprospiraceae bacterium]|nr:T9SS type A sorting domain-containing protein [Saprospiraceae bacterium]